MRAGGTSGAGQEGQWGYGIHAPVIAEIAFRIGLAAELFDRVEAVYAAVDRGNVPIAIVPDGGRGRALRWRWRTPQGKLATVINAEHSVVVRGYDSQTVWVNDPKGKVWTYPATASSGPLLSCAAAWRSGRPA